MVSVKVRARVMVRLGVRFEVRFEVKARVMASNWVQEYVGVRLDIIVLDIIPLMRGDSSQVRARK